jgi:Tat protein secretion system quality control protein TatD with DNase activity
MAKGGGKRGGRKGSRHEEDESSPLGDASGDEKGSSGKKTGSAEPKVNLKDLDFKDRREVQRKAAADKRRGKQHCHLCGEVGHVRRECHGVMDDGRGDCKYTKKKGDPGATTLKGGDEGTHRGSSAKQKQKAKKGHERDRVGKQAVRQVGRQGKINSDVKDENDVEERLLPPMLEYPPGFEPILKNEEDEDPEAGKGKSDAKSAPFHYFDSGCCSAATLDYIQSTRFGTTGSKTKTREEALALFHEAMSLSCKHTNYGGCLDHLQLYSSNDAKHLSKKRADNREDMPWEWNDEMSLDESRVWFVAGFDLQTWHEMATVDEDALTQALLESCANPRVVGLFCRLDYTGALESSRETQLQMVKVTKAAASQANVPLQIQVSPGCSGKDTSEDPYQMVMEDLNVILEEASKSHPDLKVHLSCWNGTEEDMVQLLQQYKSNLWIGLDATATFSKAAYKQAHDCAYEVPLNRILIETGTVIPSSIAKHYTKEAFVQAGWMPFIAASVALRKGKLTPTAAEVAKRASENMLELYGIQVNS